MPTPLTPLTPAKRLGRPSLANKSTRPPTRDRTPAPASPLLPPPASTVNIQMLARKTSYNQLTQNSLAAIPDASAGYGLSPMRGERTARAREIQIGDLVDTPNGLYGTVRFIGAVKGKAGTFVGVELEPDLAGKGKNDGTVDGVRYFSTSQPASGIFVPLGRASKRHSTDSTQTPPTPTLTNSSNPPSLTPHKLRSESPSRQIGARTPGPRPSLPRPGGDRPESPIRRGTPGPPGARPGLLQPQTPRSVSGAGSRIGALSPTPGKIGFTPRPRTGSVSSNYGPPGQRSPSRGTQRLVAKPVASIGNLKQPKFGIGRAGSAMSRPVSSMDKHTEEEPPPPTPSLEGHPEFSSIDSGISMSKSESDDSHTVAALRAELAAKDAQLKEQAASLVEMEASLSELQSLVTSASASSGVASPHSNTYDDADTAQLRSLVREKNDKIQRLTAEFDAHRADFRSTIDALELASSETERVYEKRVEELLDEIRELQDRNADVESVALQLKQLEELVSELEEGLEDARRGEAEARGEVEFLRGEVERSREELRREREKSAAAVANAAVGKMMRNGTSEDVEKKDDEIRGLKAIIHSLSVPDGSQEDGGPAAGAELAKERHTREELQKQVAELSGLISSKATRESELEREIEHLRKRRDARSSHSSENTITGQRDSSRSIGSWRAARHNRHGSQQLSVDTSPALPAVDDSTPTTSGAPEASKDDSHEEHTPIDSDADSSVPWCEICETAGHDILTCTNMFGSAAGGPASAGPAGETTSAAAAELEQLSRQNSAVSGVSGVSAPAGVDIGDEEAPTTDGESDGGVGMALGTAEELEERERKKKSVHLPAPPPMVDGFGPVAGKESGVVDVEKWCALCERDGHESFDCPMEEF